jgi:hypothetical protein
MFDELAVAVYLHGLFVLIRRGGHWTARAALVAAALNDRNALLAALAAARRQLPGHSTIVN